MAHIRVPLLPQWFRWALVGAVALLIVVYSVRPLPPELRSLGIFGLMPLGKYVHLVAYAGMAGVVTYALLDSDRPQWLLLSLAFVGTVAFGVGMELVQLTLPQRHFSVYDILINTIGTGIVVILWRVVLVHAQLYRVESLTELTTGAA